MSGLTTTLVLRDGSQVSMISFMKIQIDIEAAMGESRIALQELVAKCNDAGYQFIKDPFRGSLSSLQTHGLVDESGCVYPDVRKIVMNSIEQSGLKWKLVSPIRREFSKL